ncbi:28S ribosomal protein S10, mitochondrial-like [Daktulosphaira vitifoliae]|uniref:28S ribosomal protein S10, mitochondrial-like n=1 Tax=Daktulosphaira vitifoliae TaxID=58002 RepID=UPI0021A9E168|nr:28S ribosomal protein S10, mitochondrial-like [Daktulosphaira vitifoliae]
MTLLLKTSLILKNRATSLVSCFNVYTRCLSDNTVLSENNTSTLATTTSLPVGELDKLYKVIEFECRGNDPAVLRSYTQFTSMTANELGIEVGKWLVKR